MKIFYWLLCFFVTFIFACQDPVAPPATAPAPGTITGKALFSGQTTHSGIVVSAELIAPTGRVLSLDERYKTRGLNTRNVDAQVTTDSSGNFSLTDLTPGNYTVTATSANSLEKAVSLGVTVLSNQTSTPSDLILTGVGSISGKATLGGQTTGNLGILVYVAGTSFSAYTKDDGTYTIAGVPAGTGLPLVAAAIGYVTSSPVSVTVAPAATTSATQIDLSASVVVPSRVTYTVDINYVGNTLTIPEQVIIDYAGDGDGCELRISMHEYTNASSLPASESAIMFYEPATGGWRINGSAGASGTNGSGGVQHIFALWSSVYFTDGTYVGGTGTDPDRNFGFMWFGSTYTNATRYAVLTIID